MGTALVIGPDELALLESVRRHAEAHRVDARELGRRATLMIPVLDRGCTCELPIGFRVAFTIEEHPGGWARHLSVSVSTPGRLPSGDALRWIGRALGMRMDISDPRCRSYLEGPEGGPPRAVNVVEFLEGGDASAPHRDPA